jgi:hypothetical protein
MIKSYYNKELDFLDVTYYGIIEVEDIISHGREIRQISSSQKRLKILTDARDATYKFSPNEIKKIKDELKENLKSFSFIKNAFIYNSPNETAYSVFLEHEYVPDNYLHAVFSTRENALKWLLEYSIK